MMATSDGDGHPSVEFQATGQDFAAAYRLHFVPTRSSGSIFGLVVLALCAVEFAFLRYDNAPLATQLLAPAGMAAVGVLIVFAGWALFAPWYGHRTFSRQPLAHVATRVTLRPDGMRFQSARGDSTLLWKDFVSWRGNAKTTLLYLSPGLFLHIPTRLGALGFAADGLRAALKREIGPPRR
jgi:hypothetical protein